jgi:regulator of extracellular matrix RemA (YlzA/DUF370 family)
LKSKPLILIGGSGYERLVDEFRHADAQIDAAYQSRACSLIIAQKPDVRMREIAATIGLTERAVQRIIDELTANGCIVVTKSGRRNRYQISLDHPLDHPVEQSRNLGDLVRFMLPELYARSRVIRTEQLPASAFLLRRLRRVIRLLHR